MGGMQKADIFHRWGALTLTEKIVLFFLSLQALTGKLPDSS
jgi:hypothetical protein